MKSNNHTGGQLEHHLQDGNVKCDGLTIANCNTMFISHLVSKANADRIVKCWNNHDRLLEALKAASLSLSTFVESNAWEPDDQKAYDQAEAAIKEATE